MISDLPATRLRLGLLSTPMRQRMTGLNTETTHYLHSSSRWGARPVIPAPVNDQHQASGEVRRQRRRRIHLWEASSSS